MTGSEYIRRIRSNIGNSLLMITGVAAVILDDENRVLLQEKAEEVWSLPAGMVEPGETFKDAVIREVKEETGLVAIPSKILGLFGGREFRYIYPNGDKVEYHVALFRCDVIEDRGYISDSETVTTQYFSKEEMPKLALPYPVEVLFDELSDPYV